MRDKVIAIDTQIHGYRQGHQLLASSITLRKNDQAVLDRLSDIAGPLRPKERFEPYLSAYPLPSGTYYVLARTWQDMTVPRAGCVRTLSLLVPMDGWANAVSLVKFLDRLNPEGFASDREAVRFPVDDTVLAPLPPAPEFRAGELLEALFLEDEKPVAVFDAPSPEIIAVRLISALWPSARRRFALSTFALSPRKVGGRDFDLVFAPKDARSKFSDWPGRRLDGRMAQSARHKWTSAIVSRVFDDPVPRLLSNREIGLFEAKEADTAAALRIALLWDELLEKLDKSPTAALGLLDIANSEMVRNAEAVESLEPLLAGAIRQASTSLPQAEAWDFVGAIARKMQGRSMPHSSMVVADAAGELAARAPKGAIALLAQSDPKGAIANLLPSIARGMGADGSASPKRALLEASPEVLWRLLAEGGRLPELVARDENLVERLAIVLPTLDDTALDSMSKELLPYLVEDWQLPAAKPLLVALDAGGIANEFRRLGEANGFSAEDLSGLLIDRAWQIHALDDARSALVDQPDSERRNALLERTVKPTVADVAWILNEPRLSSDLSARLLVDLMRRADDGQFSTVLCDEAVGAKVVVQLQEGAADLLERTAMEATLPIDPYVRLVGATLDKADPARRVAIAGKALGRCLAEGFDGDEVGFLAKLLGIVGDGLDGVWVARVGLERRVSGTLASRNMLAFIKAPQPARLRIIWSIDEVARVLRGRGGFDLNAAAAEACVRLMSDAEKVIPETLLTAAGILLPTLMRSRREPVSRMIAVLFPLIYRELAKESDVPDLLKFVPFFDWDRCKSARQELVSAFMSSSWSPGDLALTACRCGDVGKILRRTAKSHGGEAYVSRVNADLNRVPEDCRQAVARTITTIRSDWSSRYNWRD